MSRYIRTDSQRQGGVSRPKNANYRMFGEEVAVGEPFQLEANTEIRKEIESSLEVMAKHLLLEAEDAANALIAKARTEAANLLESVNAQVRERVQQAENKVQSIQEAAHEEGFKAGFQEGYADATAHVEQESITMLQGAQILVEGAYQAEKQVLKNFEKQAASIIKHMVERILHRELADSPETLVGIVAKAVESLYISGKVQVVVSPEIILDLREYTPVLNDAIEGMSRFEWIADPALDREQLYIIGQDGCFDLSPLNQMEQLMTPLAQNLQLPRAEMPPAAPVIAEPEQQMPADMDDTVDLQTNEMLVEMDPLESYPLESHPIDSLSTEQIPEGIADEVEMQIALAQESEPVALPQTEEALLGSELINDEPDLDDASNEMTDADPAVDALPYDFPALDTLPEAESDEEPDL